MTRRGQFLLFAIIAAMAAHSMQAQCVVGSGFNMTGVSSIGITGPGSISSDITSAAGIWDDCSGMPTLLPNQSAAATGGINVSVTYVNGPSTRTDGACAQGAPTMGTGGTITGGEITVWSTWGTGAPVNLRGTDCTAQFGSIIAHELGHVLGLGNSGASCPEFIMGQGVWNGLSSANDAECEEVAEQWTTPAEEEPPPPPTEEINHNGSPIVLAVGNDPYRMTSLADGVRFDLRNDGSKPQLAWTRASSSIAFLALDRNGNGRIDSGAELFGDYTLLGNGARAANGFEALVELDANGDGLVDVNDPAWTALQLWMDRDHDGLSAPHELTPIGASAVTALSTAYRWIGRRDGHGNLYRYTARFWLRIGGTERQRLAYDVFFVMEH